ncbi:DnaK suppressor protein [Elusimicrobium posterum]|uniref:TraR/DksA family transcriptional regulator n=1 Tax=Elusimicrobium posterum TaxID=3116653 RepID=UPI003C740DA9
MIKKQIDTMKAAASKVELLTEAEIKEIKESLIEMRNDAMQRLKDKKEMDMPENIGGDPIDTATQSLDKEMLFELTDSSQNLIDQIESALRKIDKGIYGKCEYCRVVLPKKRIKALPFARYCVSCQSSREGGNNI